LEQAGQLAARNPKTRLVIDHLGIRQPFEPPPPAQPWAELPRVLALAAHPNVAIKITGACTLSHEPFPYKDIWDPLAHIFDAFTFDRCMWGTDARGQIADLQRGDRGVPRYRPAIRWRPRQANGRHTEPHLQLVAVEGLSADPESDPRLRR